MKEYKGLFEYISYFEGADASTMFRFEGEGKTAEGPYAFSHPVYDQQFLEFIDAVYESGLIDIAYFSILNRYLTRSFHDMVELIEEADLELLRAVLAYYVRQERFGAGIWSTALKDRIFLKALKRLAILVKENSQRNHHFQRMKSSS